jgi:hypothetical protein
MSEVTYYVALPFVAAVDRIAPAEGRLNPRMIQATVIPMSKRTPGGTAVISQASVARSPALE